jgi:hypothetical protein
VIQCVALEWKREASFVRAAHRRIEALPWIYQTRDRSPFVEIGLSAKGNSCKESAARARRDADTALRILSAQCPPPAPAIGGGFVI